MVQYDHYHVQQYGLPLRSNKCLESWNNKYTGSLVQPLCLYNWHVLINDFRNLQIIEVKTFFDGYNIKCISSSYADFIMITHYLLQLAARFHSSQKRFSRWRILHEFVEDHFLPLSCSCSNGRKNHCRLECSQPSSHRTLNARCQPDRK